MATIKPVHALVASVMAGVGEPVLLVKGSASPHTYALRPSDAGAVHSASVLFRVSEALEPFTGKIARALPESVRVVSLAEAPGVTLLDLYPGSTEAAAGPAGHPHPTHAHSDGHVWLDPENAAAMVGEIARVLAEVSPPDAAVFHANAERTQAALRDLEAGIARELEPVRQKPFVVFHDAYRYFARRFDLALAGSITLSPLVQPSAKRLSEIRRMIESRGVGCVFAEPLFQPQLVAAVIEGTDARSGTLDPEGTLVEPGPDAYAALMRKLASSLKECLAAGG